MKLNKYHILFARLLLFIFVAGQVVLYGHQHKAGAILSKVHSAASQQTVTEKCQLCDAMHHHTMVVGAYYAAISVVESHYDYKAVTYSFVSLSLILSTGRAPPVS